MRARRGRGRAVVALLAALVVPLAAACSSSAPILANPAVVRAQPSATPSPPPRPPDPQPVAFPRDDGPHDRLTEWWYYTGHLHDTAGHRFGFEYVIFRAERGSLPVSWAAHLAITDEATGRFVYAQRSEIGPQVDRSPRSAGSPTGFAFGLLGLDPSQAVPVGWTPWTMAGANGRDRLSAIASQADAAGAGSKGAFGLDLEVATEKPPALHGGSGWIDFGPAGGSYYYSRTRMAARGALLLDGHQLAVEGTAWFDHQWGDFIAVGGGWDWFALELANGTDLTLSVVRALDGTDALVYGTLVRADGSAVHLDRAAFTVAVDGYWTSPRTGIRYPAGWTIEVPAEGLRIQLRPSVADQELDTRATSGVVYWEGSQIVRASVGGRSVAGEAYVELTGYGR